MNEPSEAEKIDPNVKIDPDDERYRGFRFKALWTLTMIGDDDQEGIIWVSTQMATRFQLTPGPAFASDERRRLNLVEFAKWIRQALPDVGQVFLHRFTLDSTEEF